MSYEERKVKKKQKKKHCCTVGWSEVKGKTFIYSELEDKLNLCV